MLPIGMGSGVIFIAFGHRCSTAAILDRCQLAGESFPFDGIVSKLNVVRDCLENDFKHFLDLRHYVKVQTATVNVIDGVVQEILTECPSVNRYYEDANRPSAGQDLTGRSTYHLQLALTHHDLLSSEDHEAFTRRIRRLREVLTQGKRKVCFYIHPLLGTNDYDKQKDDLLDAFTKFGGFLAERYTNTSGLFFILVKARDRVPAENNVLLLKTDACAVHVIYVNPEFMDAGAPFAGNYERELQTMIDIVRREASSTAPTYSIYFPLFDDPESASNEVRLTQEGLLAHPRVHLVDRPELADYLILCQNHLVDHNPFHVRFGPIKDKYKEKTIMLDYGDDPGMIFDAADFRWRLYFKRSTVDRENGRAISYGDLAVQPTAYCVANDMCDPPAGDDGTRGLDVSCLFDDSVLETPHFMMARGRLLKFAKRLAATHRHLSTQIGTVSECGPVGRARIDPRYKQCLYDSKIILHANPDPWEGDSRLWEALASGALVFVDRLHAPIKNPLTDGEHLIFYDLTDEGMETLERKIIHYLNDDLERQRIGMQGRAFVLEHHRSVDRVSEIIHELERTTPEATGAITRATGTTYTLDVIVSIATGYRDVDQYRQFVSTLRRTGATCPILLGISDGPEYEPVKRYLLDNSVNTFIVPPIAPASKVVNGYRFAQYRDWLRDLDFRYALMMDFRDAYFQRDPFVDGDHVMRDCDLYLMSEFQLLTVGNHPNGMNYAWVAEPFGKAAADAIADKVILNSGAIMGRKNAVMKLLDALSETAAPQNFDFADQGTLNYLGHTGRLDHCGRIKIARAGESVVNNCGFTELDLLRERRAITAEDEARIAFIPRDERGRLKLYRDHEGWVLDDDGSISTAVHQYDRFLPEMGPFVSRLSDHECPERVFVNSGNRSYRGERYTLSSRAGLRPDAVQRLIGRIKSLPVDRKPLLVVDAEFRRGFAFAYGTLNVDLLFEPEAFRQSFFDPSCDARARARFLDKWGYGVGFVDEKEIFLEWRAPRSAAGTARSFAEARAQAERWTLPAPITDRIQHITSAWKGHEEFAVKLVEFIKPEVVVDLGVDYGFSAFAFALSNIGTVYGIDWFQGDEYAGHRTTYERVLAEKENLDLRNVVIIKAEFAEAARSWDRKIDVLHIDGDHGYESVKQDFEQWASFVRDDGIILMHDTMSFPEDVGRFYDELQLPKFNFTHSHGLGVVCKNRALLDRVVRL